MAIEIQTPATLPRASLLAAAGEIADLAQLTTLGRTSTILTEMHHAASLAHDWHTASAATWLMGRMTACGLHSSRKSQKAVREQVARLADAVIERAKVEQAAEVEALAQMSEQTHALALYDAAAWLADGSLVPLTAEELAEVAAAFRPFSSREEAEAAEFARQEALLAPLVTDRTNPPRCVGCGNFIDQAHPGQDFHDTVCANRWIADGCPLPEPEPPEPTTPASASVPQQPEQEEAAIGLALYDAWEAKQAAAHYSEEQALAGAFHGIERWLLALEHRSIQRQAQAFWQDYDAALPDILNDWEARCDVLLDLEESDEAAAWNGGMVA